MRAVRRTPGRRDQTPGMPGYPKIPLDIAAGLRAPVRADAERGRCFICSIVAGERDDHLVVFRDDVCIAFLAKWPTLLGYTLVAPLDHRTDAVGSVHRRAEYVELQRRVHRVGARGERGVVPTERLYVLSLGSHQGNAHVHWHVAPLPPGVPVRRAAVRGPHARATATSTSPRPTWRELADRIAGRWLSEP